MQERSSSKSSIAAFVAGSTTIMLFPLEKIKLHMIVSDKVSQNHVPYYKNSLEAFRTLKAQGIRNLYRGFHFQFTVSIAWAVYFYIYESFKKLHSSNFKNNYSEIYKFTVAMEASFISNFIINPLMVMKTRALLLRNSQTWFLDTIEATIKTWKVDGIKGFWRGYLVGNILSLNGAFTIYFYEFFKDSLKAENDFWKTSLAGGLSKLFASSMFFPITLLKIRLQQEQYIDTILKNSKEIKELSNTRQVYYGLKHCAQEIWTTQGFRGFYRGLFITLLKIVPSQALFFAVYESTFKLLS